MHALDDAAARLESNSLYSYSSTTVAQALHDAVHSTRCCKMLTIDPMLLSNNCYKLSCEQVIGYPALASTSMEQGRRAALHMWNAESTVVQQLDDRMTAEGSEIDSAQEHSTVQ
jgi:hypothetical protein